MSHALLLGNGKGKQTKGNIIWLPTLCASGGIPWPLVKEGITEGQDVRWGDAPGVIQDSENPADAYRKENGLIGVQDVAYIRRSTRTYMQLKHPWIRCQKRMMMIGRLSQQNSNKNNINSEKNNVALSKSKEVTERKGKNYIVYYLSLLKWHGIGFLKCPSLNWVFILVN